MSLTSPIPLGISTDDLAPADFRSAEFDWTGFTISFIDSIDHPRFDLGYEALWREFGHRNEMEQRDVIAERFAWRPERAVHHHALLYEMVVIMHEDQLAAVRDHTAIVDLQHVDEPVTVHLSHLLVMPRYRGSGIAGWMRAAPIRTARECLDRARQKPRPITLVAEMEPADPTSAECVRRLAAYEKVGFVKIDPKQVHYLQPDFRAAADIDASAGPTPVPLSLVVRRVKREQESHVSGKEVRAIVESLYTMYARTFRPQDMQANYQSLASYPSDETMIELVAPTRPD